MVTRITKVCHALMFLYGAAYWIQIGLFPVCELFLLQKSHKVNKTTDVSGDSVLIKHTLSFPLYMIYRGETGDYYH